MPLSSHTAWVSAGGGTLSVSQPEGGKEHCGPVPTDILDATAADRASAVDSTSQEPGADSPKRPRDSPVRPTGDSVNLTLPTGRNSVQTSEQPRSGHVVIGVDTHKRVHVAAMMDTIGGILATRTIPTDTGGFQQLTV